MSYEDKTRDELREELKERELPVSGSKSELIERLEEDDQADDADGADDEEDGEPAEASEGSEPSGGSDDGGSRQGSDGSGPSGGLKPMQLVRLAGAQLMQLTGRDIDGTSGIEHTSEGWRVLLEVVEVARVPRSMDVLGLYEVIVDEDGDLVRYERIRRFGRTQSEDSE